MSDVHPYRENIFLNLYFQKLFPLKNHSNTNPLTLPTYPRIYIP